MAGYFCVASTQIALYLIEDSRIMCGLYWAQNVIYDRDEHCAAALRCARQL